MRLRARGFGHFLLLLLAQARLWSHCCMVQDAALQFPTRGKLMTRIPSNPTRRFRPMLESLEDRLAPAAVPAGFSETTWASGIAAPTAMEFAPDGRLFVLEQAGNVRVISSSGVLQSSPFLSLTVDSTGERGLLGIAFDPNFSTTNFLYLYYTTSSG